MKKMNTGVKMPIFYTTIISPLGPIYIAFTRKGVSRMVLGVNSEKAFVKELEKSYHRIVKRNDKELTLLKKEIRAYFDWPVKIGTGVCPSSHSIRKWNPFSFRFPIDLLEGTTFERKVWFGIKKIPYGKVISYKELATRVGRPEATRAIGMACKKNPLPILIPCHRVVGKDRSLRGYSSGINMKRKLLEIEGVHDIRR